MQKKSTPIPTCTKAFETLWWDVIKFEWLEIIQQVDPKLLSEEQLHVGMDQDNALVMHEEMKNAI